MKAKRIISVLLAGIIASSAALSVSAATISDVSVFGDTVVKANIVDPGSVSYVITIPSTADFGAAGSAGHVRRSAELRLPHRQHNA